MTFQKYPPYFSLSVGNSVGNSVGKLTRSDMHVMHCLLEFAQSVGDFFGNIIRRQITDGLYSIGKFVGDCCISSDYFQTLCEMPTNLILSVCTSLSVQEKSYLYCLFTFLQTLK